MSCFTIRGANRCRAMAVAVVMMVGVLRNILSRAGLLCTIERARGEEYTGRSRHRCHRRRRASAED